jgi:hypothetical protein
MNQKKNETQTNLNTFYNFNISDSFETTPKSLATSTRGTDFTFKPVYSCSCKKGYSPFFDPYTWKRPEEPDDCSRADIRKAYRLGGGF